MYIVQIASECAPVAKVGGLADVVYGLSRELEAQEHTVEVILPKYDCMRYDHIYDLHVGFQNLNVPWDGGIINCTVWCGWVHGQQCFFIEPHSNNHYFNRGHFYGSNDDNMRFAFFSKAALEFLLQANKHPDILHCHDWQTGLIPVMLYDMYASQGMGNTRVCYTVHNFRHQGIGGVTTLWATGLHNDSYYMAYERLRDNFNPNALNFMKGGIVYSNHVTTVSPHHAWEARNTEISCGLGHTLDIHQNKFGGILNGIDYNLWNPETDKNIPFHFSAKKIANKAKNKKALRDRLLLRDEDKPIVAYIGRLDQQKGVHLVKHAIHYALYRGAQFVLLGTATDRDINNQFWARKNELNENPDCHLELAFDGELAHLIYAASDIMVVPSNYEPCGLTQIISLRYGTIPVVRGVGGLVSTVFDRDYDEAHEPEERNGYVFYQSDGLGLESAMDRALGLYWEYPKEFKQLQIQGMKWDYSWKVPAQQYIDIYNHIKA